MFRPTLIALILLPLTYLPAAAQGVFVPPPDSVMGPDRNDGQFSGKRAYVARKLPLHGFGNVDVGRLTNQQVVLIDNAIHSGRSIGDINARIGSIIRGGGLLQNIVRGL